MLFWRRPGEEEVDAVLREQARLGFTYEGYVRLTRDARSAAELETSLRTHGESEAAAFDVDHLRVQLGTGADCFVRAKEAMMSWKMLQVPSWLHICWPHSSIREGETLGALILNMGLYSLTAFQIIYTINEGPPAPPSLPDVSSIATQDEPVQRRGVTDDRIVERFGFAYGTLPCHLVAGEERFLIEWDKSDGTVWYDLLSFSKPQHWMAKVGYPIARWYQEQYHQATAQAILQAIHDEPEQTDTDV